MLLRNLINNFVNTDSEPITQPTAETLLMKVAISTLETHGVPIQVAQLARDLHTRRSTELVIPHDSSAFFAELVGEHPLWSCSRGSITFVSLEARNQCVGALAFAEWIAGRNTEDHKSLLKSAHELWRNEIGHSDQACGRFLALVHTKTNIFSVAVTRLAEQDVRVFDVLHVVGAAVGYLDSIVPKDLIALIDAQYEKTKHDMASGVLFNQVEAAIARDTSTCRFLYAGVKENPSVAISGLYQTSLMALARAGELDEAVTTAVVDTQSQDPLIQKLAHWTIAVLLAQYELTKSHEDTCVDLLRTASQSSDDEHRQSAIRAIGIAAKRCKALRPNLLSLANSQEQLAISVLADFLFMNLEEIKQDSLFSDMLLALCGLLPETKGGLDNFDWVLSQLVESTDFDELSVKYLTIWAKRHGSARAGDRDLVEAFDQTVFKLLEQPKRLEKLITSWLIADARELGAAAGGLVSFLWVRNYRQINFCTELVDALNAPELLYLARRMLGYVHSEEAILSLTFSLLDTQNAASRTFSLVHTLLTKEVGRNYIGSTLKEMEQRRSTCNPETKALLDSAHSNLSNYLKAIESLPRLQELKPPLSLRRALSAKQAKAMRESMDQANEQSVFSQLATKISLKAGVGWFAVDGKGIGETHKLQSFSNSVSIPRQATNDPVGYAITGMQFRLAKKSDQ